jgi:class 3 adenylate cyclase
VTRLATFARPIIFDKRGTGLSDRTVGIASLEERMDDVRAVMDAVGSERAALFGMSEAGPMSMLFSATYPERTQALILYGTFARAARLADLSADQFQQLVQQAEREHGTGASLPRWVASRAADETFRRAWARFERQSASPAAVVRLVQMNREIDVRHVLPTIKVPTLVLHRSEDVSMPVTAARSLAAGIPGARLVEMPGIDHIPIFGDADRVIDEVEEFLTGSRREPESDRVLATVMFTDIVESTQRAAELGDRQWRALLDRHDQAVREQLQRHRGRAVKSLGDGFLATFDGPARAVRCAAAIARSVTPLGIAVRCGLHTGEIELLRDDDIGGIAVHIAARVADLAGPGEALVSNTVRNLVAGSGLRFEDRGVHALRGLPEPLRLFRAAA